MESSINIPSYGMKLNKSIDTLSNGEYSLLVNGNIQSQDSFLRVTNEQSNLLCSRFKPGYKVIGLLPINIQRKTIFFLVNPETNQSEIGSVDNIFYEDVSDPESVCEGCNKPLTEEELNTTIELCKYTTIVNASCLNFNINYPISATYEIGVNVEDTLPDANNLTVFFADFLNVRRYINLSNYPKQIIGYGDCNVPIYNEELDCNAIKVVPEYSEPCISFVDAPLGGINKAGVYQFTMAYANVNRLPLTDYSAISNPISLSSELRITTVNTDYNTNKAIKFTINNIDQQFQYVNIVVLKTINGLTEAFLVTTIPTTSDSITYTYTGDNYQNEPRVTLDELLKKRAIYEYAKGVTTANKHLFWWNLKDQRQINLQPVVSEIPLQWQTVEAVEGFYGNPLSADFVSYERDEVNTFGIEFRKTNGYKLPTFLFVGRSKQYYLNNHTEKEVLPDSPPFIPLDVDKPMSGDNVLISEGCAPELLNNLWQVYNTATVSGDSSCYSNPTGTITIKIPNTFSCLSEVFEIPSGTVTPPVEPCVAVTSNCSDVTADDYSCCELLEITPSGVVELPVFDCTPITLEATPCAVDITTYTPTNIDCVNATTYLMQTGNSCYLEQYTCGDPAEAKSTLPYGYFKCGLTPDGVDCDGNSSGRNSQWWGFQAIAQEQLVRFVSETGIPTIRVFIGDCVIINNAITAGNPSAAYVTNLDSANNPSCKTGSDNTVCLTLNNLTEGATYFVQVTVNEDCGTTPVPIYGNLCITAPQAQSRYSFDQPAIYQWKCLYNGTPDYIEVPIDPTCFTTPYKYGDFAYWESTLTYPNNPDVWGNLCGQPIRHFKFPDSCKSHIHSTLTGKISTISNVKTRIYPIGVKIDINDVKNALNQAVDLGLITEEEKLEITQFSIKRGNRRNNRSIHAKGMLYDIWKTPKLDGQGNLLEGSLQYQYYPNYPYNDLHNDIFLNDFYGGSSIAHPYASENYKNNRYTFHSPNTSFNKPELGTELKLETTEWGAFGGQANKVDKHAEYVLLTNKAYNVSKVLASLQITQEASASAMGAGDSFGVLGTSGGALINYIIYFAIGLGMGFATNYAKYTADWLDIIKGLSDPKNPTLYFTSVGTYNSFNCVKNSNTIPKRRLLANYRYLNSGNYQFTEQAEQIFLNNYERESSVYVSINKPNVSKFLKPNDVLLGIIPEDNSRQKNCNENGFIGGNVVSYYASIKSYVPDQYGTVDQIQWLDTGYCGNIDWNNPNQNTSCDTIFGGDTYINRVSEKHKIPFFLQDAVGLAEDSPIMYKNIGNVGFPKYFFNTIQDKSSLEKFDLPFLAPPNVNLDTDCLPPNPKKKKFMYYSGKMYLYNYGVPSYICESDYNVDLRHAENDGDYKDFYPHVGDVVSWTQQWKNPISFDNTYYYNLDYSKQNRENFYHILRNSFSNSLTESRAVYPNRAIYSGQGVSKWKQYLAADYYDFPLEDGQLISLNPGEKDRVIVRQSNSTKVYNAYITQQSSLETIQISVGDMFATKPQEYYKSDLGFGGSNHTAFTSTPFGHFYVDSQNPSIFQLQDGLKDITRDSKTNNKIQWFVENLPFKILKDFPSIDVDNNFKYFGITITFDNKFDRIFFTKRDAQLKKEYRNKVIYTNFNFVYNNEIIEPTDTTYFEQKSWTIAYSPLLQTWLSFYSFTPNYYISTEQYFATGINYSNDATKYGLWNHNLTNKSFQIYYGKKYPFILEYATKTNYNNQILNNLALNVDFRRYQADLNYFVKDNVSYDFLEIYNQNQSTGRLNLIPKIKNNGYQATQYPKIVNSTTQVLVENLENFWWVSQGFKDLSYNNGQPLYTYQGKPYKELNLSAISYAPKYLPNLLRSDYFAIRAENNKTNYQLEHKFTIQSQTKS